MTGQELFYGLSFVDDKYIAEAEVARLGRGMPWKQVLSVAACLCILLTGMYAMMLFQPKGASEEAAAPAAPAPESVMDEAFSEEAAAAAPAEAAPKEETPETAAAAEADEEKIPAGELQHIPYARMRITHVDDGSFEAIVEEISDEPTIFEVGMQVTLVVDPAKVPGADREITNDLSGLTEGVRITIENGAYDAGLATLYVAEVFFGEGE